MKIFLTLENTKNHYMKHSLCIACMIFLLLGFLSGVGQSNATLYSAPLGVEAFTFRKSFPIDPKKTLDSIALMGFPEIESGNQGMSPGDFKKLCNARGINIVS